MLADMDLEKIKLVVKELPLLFTSLPLGHFLKQCQLSEKNDVININISLGFYLSMEQKADLIAQWVDQLNRQFLQENKLIKFEFIINCNVASHKNQLKKASHQKIKNIILIASGKGGVGKSTVTANLALSLQAQGAKVGILDADIYGPSQPQIMGNYNAPEMLAERKFKPLNSHGISMISIGNLVNLDAAMIWRGPMVSQALRQLLNDTQWSDLDYLLVDLPPGTGDIQLTIAKDVPVAGGLIVTTPQDLSLLDANRAIEMFRKVGISVVGIIENMTTFICPNCAYETPIFGHDGGMRLSMSTEVPLLGKIPLALEIRNDTDNGKPTVIEKPNSKISQCYQAIALASAAYLSLKEINHNRNMPEVKVELSKE
ncbi:iron-sulfur cluster carrier protein ApbC [Thiotrichales bacterium 19S3-7]|nr:iron-sulfur cluster carrier protein ApbC [Thiotrichales bacterium 19S3-7]MCF6802439.1 iron-sulfur cluster carrier protein ApbC [Thiotrichales bacterium 19S3-11]